MEDQNKDIMQEGLVQEEATQMDEQIQEEAQIQEEGQMPEEPLQVETQMQTEGLQTERQIQEEATQAEQSGMETSIYTTPDVYQTQTGQEVYQTQTGQDVYQSSYMNDENHDTVGLFSGGQPENSVNGNVYGNQYQYGNNGYGENQYQYGNNGMNGNQYQYGNNGINGNQYQYGNNETDGSQYQYGNNVAAGNQYQYGNNGATGNQYQYGNNGATGNQYQYGNNGAAGNQYQYGNNGAAGNQYQYGNNGAAGNQYQYGNPYAYNQNGYSPYAAPQKKKQTGLIIGIIIAIVVIFLIALLAIIYNAFKTLYNTAGREDAYSVMEHTDDDTDRDNDDNRNSDNDKNYRDYGHDDTDYDDDDYYEFHDDIKDDLSYSIKWNYFEYDTDNENVSIDVNYPVIIGDEVTNLERLNAVIAEEASFFSEYYEETYAQYMDDSGDSYFKVKSTGYVTYMSESVLSVAFQEEVNSDFFVAVKVYCINIDMNAGVVMDNTDIIEVDDDFSVDFRYRSEEQNGEISTLDSLSDQEITKLFKSEDNLIIFYTPQGMEIGINYDDYHSWVTVTYHDFKKYLKVF